MRHFLFGCLLAAAAVTASVAAPCPIASLADYQALGSNGCTIGTAPTFTYSDFTFSQANSGSPVTADDIEVAPMAGLVGGLQSLGLMFSSDGFQAADGQMAEYHIGYLVDPPPPEIIRFSANLSDPGSGEAYSQVTTSLCFDNSDCPRSATLTVLENVGAIGVPPTKLSDSVDLNPYTVYVLVDNDIVLSANTGGSISIQGFDNISGISGAAPEPASMGLVAGALLGLAVWRSRTKAV